MRTHSANFNIRGIKNLSAIVSYDSVDSYRYLTTENNDFITTANGDYLVTEKGPIEINSNSINSINPF